MIDQFIVDGGHFHSPAEDETAEYLFQISREESRQDARHQRIPRRLGGHSTLRGYTPHEHDKYLS